MSTEANRQLARRGYDMFMNKQDDVMKIVLRS